MRTTISILGCGWLGTALGKKLLSKRYIVYGSTTSTDKYNMEITGIQPYYIKIGESSMEIDYANFFNTDILIIALPPQRIENIEEIFPPQIEQIIQYILKLKIPKVLFISSTSVYESTNVVHEGEEGNPEKQTGKALLTVEKSSAWHKNNDSAFCRFNWCQ